MVEVKAGRPEFDLQVRVVQLVQRACQSGCRLHASDARLLDVLLQASLNGLFTTKKQAFDAKRAGAKRGVADLQLPLPRGPFHGLAVELKTKRGAVREEQRRYLTALSFDAGWLAVVMRERAAPAADLIVWYAGLPPHEVSAAYAAAAQRRAEWAQEAASRFGAELF